MGGTTVRERDLIDRTPEPRTRQSLAKDLRRLVLATGAVVIVHSSLSSLGWVCGASVAVVQALMDVITPSGTLVMPAHSGEYSDPANWEHPPVPDSWQGPIRENSLGEGSPLARIYELDGRVLLLGVGHASNTSFHLAEYRAPGSRRIEAGAPILEGGRRVWKTYEDIELDEEVFEEIGADFENAVGVRNSGVGSANARLFSQREAVDFAQEQIACRRRYS